MHLAIEEARKGQGKTSPNPCVGAVIVLEDVIIGMGYHKKAGTPHAEVNAIADAGSLTGGATLYVTLEPCNHTGRTPPCTQAILKAGISRVVVGMPDPNPSVIGKGSDFLRAQGLEVESGILEEECRQLNRPFVKHSATGMPWIIMKAGMSLDGKISYARGQGGRITGDESRAFTHSLRNTTDAILVGVDTAIIDNPSLTTRLQDNEDSRDPVRVILDTRLRLPADSRMLTQESSAPTWIFCGPDAPVEREQELVESGAVVYRAPLNDTQQLDLHSVGTKLGELSIHSVLVEGGAAIHSSFLNSRLVDEFYLFVAPLFIGQSGTPLLQGDTVHDIVRAGKVDVQKLGSDILVHGFPE